MNMRMFYRRMVVPALFLGLGLAMACADEELKYKINGKTPGTGKDFSLSQLEALIGVEVIASSYFDRAMNYRDSRLHVISFSRLVDQYHPEPEADAALLNCFDDYQGIVSLEEVRRYNLQLATRIEIQPEFKRPDWLNPLSIIVPDGNEAPYLERFMTANIREIKFVRLEDYYAPLRDTIRDSSGLQGGRQVFKDNCLFCHSLKGVGGNKGIDLPAAYDFSQVSAREKFKADFFAFHHKDNADKQNVEQFVSKSQVEEIAGFLRAFSE